MNEVEAFLMWMSIERGRAHNTLAAYRRDLRRYVGWLDEQSLTIGTAVADDANRFVEYLRNQQLAPASIARSVVVVRALYRYLAAEGLIETDPTQNMETPRRPSGLPKALTEPQIGRLFDAVEAARTSALTAKDTAVVERDGALLEVLYGSGLRISEAVGLSLADIDLEARLIRAFGKGAKERIVPIGRHAVAGLALWIDEGRRVLSPKMWRDRHDETAVFLNQRGGRLTRQGGWLVLSGYAKTAGLASVVSPHVLRHSCATHMLDHGADIRAVQELLGHASISTTQTYTKVMTDRLWSAYAASHPRARGALHGA